MGEPEQKADRSETGCFAMTKQMIPIRTKGVAQNSLSAGTFSRSVLQRKCAGIDAALKKFFGPHPNATRIALRLRDINKGLKGVTIECENPASFAYTRGIPAIAMGNIHLCQPQFHDPTVEQRAETIVHEGSHKFIGTGDNGYYTLNCDETAETQALSDSGREDNADCYGCLVQTLL